MKQLLQIFAITKGHRKSLFIGVLFNNLGVLFSLASFTLVIPILDTIFLSKKEMMDLVSAPLPPFEYSREVMTQHINHYLVNEILENSALSVLMGICMVLITAITFKNLFTYLGSVFLSKVVHGTVTRIRGELFNHISKLQLAFFSKERKGDVLARMTNDMKEIEWAILFSTQALFKNPFEIIVYMAFLSVMSPKLTSFLIIFLPISGVLISWIGKSLRKTSTDGTKTMSNLLSVAEETVGGIKIIKAFNARKAIISKFYEVNNAYNRLMIKVYRKTDLASPVSEIMGVLATATVLLYGGNLVFEGELKASFLIGYIILFAQLINPFKSLSKGMYNAHRGLASLERVNEIIDTPLTIVDQPDAKSIKTFEQGLEFKNVSFKYEQAYVLKDINFKINKGQTIALVGQSGSGKSTLSDLIPRFYEVEEGELLLDGHLLKDYKTEDVRQLMGIVTQQSVLFNDTVANNIAFGIDASKEQIIEAAKIANAHQFIESLENGYETNIGDGGNKLSGGQKQRVSIARAILKNPPIMILDEATSALDTESEKLVQEALTNLMKNRTSLVIAHRLSTIQHADEILVMHEGEIVERGKHEELYNLEGGYYRKLCDLQSFA